MPDVIRDPGCSNAGAEAADRLREALGHAGFTLPAINADEPVRGTAMVDLGRAPAGLVSRIAEWIAERA
ncbi:MULTISPECIES: hypothetical protein [Streptomyces]|uniref:Uncharacterized protein n=2 Tax=Streptomyces TaxID=1883 RepID=A0A420V8Q4_9ACTN|nr:MULTISPECIES: hypothetical protein [Streptomyces]KNE83976.1 hypothetical protein ADZ36_01365 [Streptomyces fradiae]OFA36997.1 hypothetical protein BEN35_29425 [Streptomyces fradiae]PQM24662.1 hypothetical protein Sfr7A_00055 [Streptomyces xinghaiensis]RKM98717.1 hypothetical protein SFRA_000055 [Streptomyces xinghaiensis]RNC76385.1 hypothetical protein DC095_004320 [Streptomyces xinghaiensis]